MPVVVMAAHVAAWPRCGGLDGDLLTSSQFFQTDYTKPLLFMADGGVLAARAAAAPARLAVGMLNETGSYRAQSLVVACTFWYQIKPVLHLEQRRRTDLDGDGRAQPGLHPVPIHPRRPRHSPLGAAVPVNLTRPLPRATVRVGPPWRESGGARDMHSDFATQLLELDRDECLRLLASTNVGRVAVNVQDWPPVIRPVNYVFDDSSKSVIFRSARGSKFHAPLGAQRAAFEIDGLEPGRQTGWSVIVVGPVEEVTNAAELTRLDRSGLRPWVPGETPHWMRIRTTVVSGRRIDPGS